jgi:hypothetical protein
MRLMLYMDSFPNSFYTLLPRSESSFNDPITDALRLEPPNIAHRRDIQVNFLIAST